MSRFYCYKRKNHTAFILEGDKSRVDVVGF